MMLTRFPCIAVVMFALAGCATTWSRPDTSETAFNLDNWVCQYDSTHYSVLFPERVDPFEYKRCMKEKGYTEGGPWKGYSAWAGR